MTREMDAIACTTHLEWLPCRNDDTCQWSSKHEDFDRVMNKNKEGK